MKNPLEILDRLLVREEAFTEGLKSTQAAKRLEGGRSELLEHVRELGRSGDLPLIVAAERAIVEGDLTRYANSQSMTHSLKAAIDEISAIERHIAIVDNPDPYRAVDRAHRLPKNRKNGLPLDEARQALASHYARLNNLDKSRLDDNEKKIIDARKSAIFAAGKLYAERQAQTLGVDPSPGKKHGNRR